MYSNSGRQLSAGIPGKNAARLSRSDLSEIAGDGWFRQGLPT
jgi:hypothetical protein